MRVLHLIPSLEKGGAERLTIDIVRELQRREGFVVQLMVLRNKNEYPALTKEISVVECPSWFRFRPGRKNRSDYTAYQALIRTFRPQIIHSHLFEAEFFSRHYRLPGVTYFSHLHDNMSPFENFTVASLFSRQRITAALEKKQLLKKYLGCNNHFIANSADTGNFFRKRLPAALTKNLYVLPNGIDLSRFPFLDRKFPSQEIRLVTTGSLVKKKNHAFLVAVMAGLKKTGKTFRLDVLGNGPLRGELEKLRDDSGLRNEIFFHGNVDDVHQYLQAAHVYVHAATYEPFGLAMVEAMASGLPVVCLDGEGNRPLIEEGGNGYCLRRPEPGVFVQRVRHIVSGENVYRQFSRHAGTIAQRYSITDYVTRLITLYQQALNE